MCSEPLRRAASRLGRRQSGHRFWRERLTELAKAQTEDLEESVAEETDDPEPEEDETPSWSPETVARGIEKFSKHGALIIRRARWLCLVSESSLAWEVRGSEGQCKNVVLFENGAIRQRQELAIGKTIPLSGGHARGMLNRQKIFDLTTYERLRVVTTELRRLVADGRQVEIQLRPRAILRRRQLSRVLPWV